MPTAPIASATAHTSDYAPRDVVSEYKCLVVPFLVLQVVSWTLALLQSFGVVGAPAWAATKLLGPVDLSLCQMMFWGTLHHGPLRDGRLSLICRVAFLIEAVCYAVNYATVYRPETVAEAAAALDTTAVVDRAARMLLGYVNAGLWFIVWAVFSAWIGVLALQFGRRRLLANVDVGSLAPFSSRFLRVYALVLVVQAALVVSAIVRTAMADTLEAQISASKLEGALFALSLCVGHLYGFKAVVFEASGTTVAQFRRGEAARLVYAAVGFAALWVLLITADLLLVAVATSSDDPILALPNAVDKFILYNVPYTLVLLCGIVNLGLSVHHLVPWRSVDDTEGMLKQRRSAAK